MSEVVEDLPAYEALGDIETTPDALAFTLLRCLACGSLVIDTEDHTAWHAQITTLEATALLEGRRPTRVEDAPEAPEDPDDPGVRQGFYIYIDPDDPTPAWADGRYDVASDGRTLPTPKTPGKGSDKTPPGGGQSNNEKESS